MNTMGDSFEELYEKYNILSDAKDKISQVRRKVNVNRYKRIFKI